MQWKSQLNDISTWNDLENFVSEQNIPKKHDLLSLLQNEDATWVYAILTDIIDIDQVQWVSSTSPELSSTMIINIIGLRRILNEKFWVKRESILSNEQQIQVFSDVSPYSQTISSDLMKLKIMCDLNDVFDFANKNKMESTSVRTFKKGILPLLTMWEKARVAKDIPTAITYCKKMLQEVDTHLLDNTEDDYEYFVNCKSLLSSLLIWLEAESCITWMMIDAQWELWHGFRTSNPTSPT